MAAVVLGAQQRPGEWRECLGLAGEWVWVWHAAKMKECDLFSHWQSFDFARARFSTADFTLWLEGGTPRGWQVDEAPPGGGVGWGGWLVAFVAFIELAISLPFELLLPLVVAYLLPAFGRALCFTSTRCCCLCVSCLSAFRFLFARFQHMLAPLCRSLRPINRIPSEQLLLSLACLLFLLFPLARKMIPTYNCFCCTPHALAGTPLRPSEPPPASRFSLPCFPLPPVRAIRAALKSFVRIYANERQFLPFVCNDVAAAVAKRGQQGQRG